MSDIVDRLRHTAGHLINGSVEDGSVEVALLCDAAEAIESLRAQVTIAKNSNGFTVLAEDKARRLEEENRRLRAEVSRSSYHCD